MAEQPKDSSTGAKIFAVLFLLAAFAAIIWVIVKIVQLTSALYGFVQSLSGEQWAVIGEILRNTGGWAALIAALGTMSIMVATNRSRAKEAASSDFRQHIQWAVEKVSSDNQFEVSFAQSVIQHFAQNRPRYLSKQEHNLVLEVQETLEKLQVLEEFPEPLHEKSASERSPGD